MYLNRARKRANVVPWAETVKAAASRRTPRKDGSVCPAICWCEIGRSRTASEGRPYTRKKGPSPQQKSGKLIEPPATNLAKLPT